MQTTTKCIIPDLSGAIFLTRGFTLMLQFGLIWVEFPMSSYGDLAVGVANGEVSMSWRTNWTDNSVYRFVTAPNGSIVIQFDENYINGYAVASYINRVRDIGNVSLGIVSFRLLNLTVADAGRYYYKPLTGSNYEGGQILVIAGDPDNVSITEVANPFENQNYTMQCSARSTSDPRDTALMHYQWKKENGQNITANDRYSFSSNQSNLTINPLKRQDAGTIVCEAWEHVGAVSQSGPFTLKVVYGPDSGSIQLTPNGTSQDVAELSPLSVNCYADCFPDCQYRWTGPGGSSIGSTGMLSIISVRRNQTGPYTCTASNSRIPSRKAAATINVVVFYGPDAPFTLHPDTTSYRNKEGTFIPNITCLANCNPPCSYHWIGPFGAMSSGVLSLGTLHRLMQGSYFCMATNPRTSTSFNGSTVHMAVIYGPDIPYLSPSTTVYTKLEGESVPDINCSADCFPGCTQVWMKGISVVQESNGGTLSLRQVYRDKASDYTCWFNNTESNATGYTSIRLDVQYPPVLVMKATNASKGGRVVIDCTASGVPDNYTFYKLTHMAPDVSRTIVRELDLTRVSNSEVSFTIEGATYQDGGFYVCRSSNGIVHYSTGKLISEDVVPVWIADQAVITSNARDFDAEKGKTAHMQIEFYSGLFHPNVTWYLVKNGMMELLQNSSDFRMYLSNVTVELQYYQKIVKLPGYNASLEVYDVDEKHFASYKVEINNSFIAPLYQNLELKPRGPPETPANLSVIPDSVTTHSLQLSWQAGFHGGASQTFVIEYREAGKTNWLNKSEPIGLVQYVTMNSTIADLKDGTIYQFRIYAENVYNRSQISKTINETTKRGMVVENILVDPSGSSVTIGAATGSAFVLLIAVAVVSFLFYKRKQMIKSSEEVGLRDNPVYDSSSPLSDSSPSVGATGVEYASVEKSTKKGAEVEDSSKMYAQVDKTNKGKKKGQVKEKRGKAPRGDIYENATLAGRHKVKGNIDANAGDLKADENVYENPSEEASKGSLATHDGLMYADLMLEPPTTKNGKYVIRGLDNLTDYTEVAYSKRGEPLSDNDEKT